MIHTSSIPIIPNQSVTSVTSDWLMIPEVSKKRSAMARYARTFKNHSDRLHKNLVDPSEDPKADHVSHKHLRCSQRPADVDSFTNHRYGRYAIVDGKIFRIFVLPILIGSLGNFRGI